MKTYKIPIVWQSYQNFEVEADNLHDAVQTALKQFLSIPDENYLEDSFEIDGVIEDEYPDENYNWQEILNNL